MIYKVIEKRNPKDLDGPTKWYGYIVNLSHIGIDELASRIAAGSTVTRPDVLAVLAALQEEFVYALQEGKSIRLGDIGSFRVVANGAGSDTKEGYDTSYLEKLHVRFTPNTVLKDALSLNNRKFALERVDFAEDEEEEEEGQI